VTGTQDAFGSAVDYYAAYRTGYPASRLDELAGHLGLDGRQRLLDVGCGPGQIAVPMARHCRSVTAIDSLPAMLEHGRANARAADVENITWLPGNIDDLADLIEPGVSVAVFAASFHWTDRSRVLRVLDDLLAPTGSVVIITDVLDEDSLPEWDHAISQIRTGYLGAAQPHLDKHLHPKRSIREVLDDSPFSDVEAQIWSWTRRLTVEQVVGLQFSYSFSSPALFGERQDAFAGDVRAAVLALHPAGVVTEPFRNEVLVATRPTHR
jgi:ubiquinone/menaquinone biosynthesis C-methylase UbiE